MKKNYVLTLERYNEEYYNDGCGYFYTESINSYITLEQAKKDLWKYVKYLKRHYYREDYGDYEFIVEKLYYPKATQIIVTINNENELYSDCWRLTARRRLSSD